MAIHFITLTTRSGKILVNPTHIKSLQDLGEAHPGEPRTNVLAGHTLFCMESVQEILEACANVETSEDLVETKQGGSRKAKGRGKSAFGPVEKRNVEAARALELLARSRDAAGAGAIDKAGAAVEPETD